MGSSQTQAVPVHQPVGFHKQRSGCCRLLVCCSTTLCCLFSCLVVVTVFSAALAEIWTRPDSNPHKGSVGWNTTGSTVGGNHWCSVEAPAANWTLRCESTSFRLSVVSYNLFWWNLFGDRHGNRGSAGKLLAGAYEAEPFDLVGFQECQDVALVLRDAGLEDAFGTVVGKREIVIDGHCKQELGCRAIALAYRKSRWALLQNGITEVAEDSPLQFYGRRSVLWARFRNIETGAMVFFMNHHGPLPVNSGGLCGGRATAYNILRVAGYFAHPGDDVVLVGDFNADPTSMTIKELSNHLGRAYTGKSFNGVDNFFTSCGRLAHVQNLGTGGSDHDALRATFDFGHATPSFSIV